MKALIDGDVLLYEAGFSGQYVDENGELQIRNFEFVSEVVDDKIAKIVEATWTDEPIIYLTYGRHLNKLVNKEAARKGLPPFEYKPNFRFEAAVTQPYKERGNKKPYHFHNLLAYLLGNYKVKVVEGIEADDAICLDRDKGVICTRDKDLRMVNGWHYGWECGGQPGFPLTEVKGIGTLELNAKGKLSGTGYKFFSAQRLMGDGVDNIPGLNRYGPVKVHKLLAHLESKDDLDRAVEAEYEKTLGEGYEKRLEEVSHLLWMLQEQTEEGYVGYDGRVLPFDTGRNVFRWVGGSCVLPEQS